MNKQPHYLWELRPYFRQVAGELVLGSLAGIAMNTAIGLPAILLGRAVDAVRALEQGRVDAAAVGWAALAYVLGAVATEAPRVGKRWWLQTANARIRAWWVMAAVFSLGGWWAGAAVAQPAPQAPTEPTRLIVQPNGEPGVSVLLLGLSGRKNEPSGLRLPSSHTKPSR